MENVRTKARDSVEYLKTEEGMAGYLEACFQEAGDDPDFIAHALGVIARARGMSQVARNTGLTRDGLYKALSEDGNPSFATILKVIRALGLDLHAAAAHAYAIEMPKSGMRPVHPGEVLREDYLAPLGMSANALASALHVTAGCINDIVRERRGITPDTPMRLARYFGGDAQTWMNRQLMYEMKIAERDLARDIERENSLREAAHC